MRLTLAPLAALLLLPVLPMTPAAAAADGGGVRVTAVVRDASGQLSFRSGRATDGVTGKRLAGRWRAERGVVAAQVDHRIRATSDPLEPQQWGLTTLRAAEVGNASGQVVAVVDTGVDATHPDLTGVVLPGTDIVSPGGDGRTDVNGHGTHIAGIVAAVAGNGIGGAGLAQGARVLPVRVMDADGSGWDADAAKGLVWAADNGATVVNLSFGGPERSPVMDAAITYALGKGVVVVVAAGNEGAAGDPTNWPAADPGVIAVGAVDSAGVRPAWSSTGNHLAVVAPGVAITSTVPGGYASFSGTSMAAPFVSAAAAVLRRAQPTLTPASVRQRLVDTADDLGPVGFDAQYGAGRVDLLAAEAVAAPTPVPAASVPAPTAVTPFYSARISASRSSVPYVGAVAVSTRVLGGGIGLPGVPLRLERLVGASWVPTRTGTSGSGGLVSWLLHPDRTSSYRAVGAGWTSPLVRVVVTPVLSLRASTGGLAGRVLPAAGTTVRIDYRRGTTWVALTYVRTIADGTFRLSRRFAVGTVLRAMASGVLSPAVRV